ncbi:MAG: hypothetical protein KatS3mg082_1364 [Nitrospiraceae bacterium]|nr:MAG: hypothetical protein KatS3mg082_1364 [Nitrospiraceae bacterium]
MRVAKTACGTVNAGQTRRDATAGAGGLALGPGRSEDIVQFALQAQPVGPVPQVGEIEVQAWVLDDADHVVKISRTASFKFEDHQVFRTHDGDQEPMKLD